MLRNKYPPEVYEFFGNKMEFFQNFLSLTNQKKVVAEHICKHLRYVLPNKKDISITLIGGGRGDAELPIISELAKMGYEISVEYIDPSRKMADEFKRRFSELKLQKVNVRMNISKFEDLNKRTPSDIIFAINSIKFLHGWIDINYKNNPLLRIYNNLNVQGVGVIVVKSHESHHTKIKNLGGGGHITGIMIRRILERLKIPFYWDTITASIDVSSIFKEGAFNPDEKGKKFLHFFFRGQWSNFDKKKKREIIEAFQKYIRKTGDRYTLDAKYECIWIYKDPPLQSNVKANTNIAHDEKTYELITKIKEKINLVKDFPKQGIIFVDTTPLLRDPDLFREIIDFIAEKFRNRNINSIVAKDMQALIWAGALAYKLNCKMIPVFRKDLVGELVCTVYSHEYNPRRVLLLQKDAIVPGENVLIIDYIMATGETMRRLTKLVKHVGGKPIVFSLIELTHNNPRRGLEDIEVYSSSTYIFKT